MILTHFSWKFTAPAAPVKIAARASRHFLWRACCAVALLLGASSQAQMVTTNHGAGVLKAIAGPDGNFSAPRAHLGDFLQLRARIFSSSGIYTNVVTPGP